MKSPKPIRWNSDKNLELQRERSISFDEILLAMEGGGELARTNHPNHEKYPHQKVLYVNYRNYVYIVPYVETDDEVFLKTVIPSRKATKYYLTGVIDE